LAADTEVAEADVVDDEPEVNTDDEAEAATEAEDVVLLGEEGAGGLLVLNAQMTSCIRFA
jgi:hypothetical protein